MQVLLTQAPGRAAVVHWADLAPPEPGRVTIDVEAAAFCGSDVAIFRGRHAHGTLPIVQGHEVCGVVSRVGPAVSPSLVGTRVVIDPAEGCGSCDGCVAGLPNACERLSVLGVHRQGGVAESVDASADKVFPVPDLDPTVAVLSEPAAVALHAIAQARPVAVRSAVILGAGSIGRALSLACHERGWRVTTVDRSAVRLDAVKRLGTDETVLVDHAWQGAAAAEDLKRATGTRLDVAFDTTGSPHLQEALARAVRPGGALVIVGISPADLVLPVAVFSARELMVRGSRNTNGEFPEAIALVRRHQEALRATVQHVFPLSEGARALELAAQGRGDTLKIMIAASRRAS